MRRNILIGLAVLLSACTAPQQAAVEAAIAKNAAKVTAVCGPILITANSPATDIVAAIVPIVAQVQAAVKGGCGTAEGIAAMAQSASSVDWLGTAKVVLESKGTVLPAPVAPAPITAATVPVS